ncbi:hypothetical protein Acr_00g0088850 [Actinidia rufa]|uniref:TF-B3 domain-containing protein n=1 Tax=Actinidia rufa TaxID=165716 RepID=A0A7J0DWR9_9ERIC|nr:hypothetical protein Acr_00g0088850 [Actinidia rufa]
MESGLGSENEFMFKKQLQRDDLGNELVLPYQETRDDVSEAESIQLGIRAEIEDLPIRNDTLVTSSSTKVIAFKQENSRFQELTGNDVEQGMISFPYIKASAISLRVLENLPSLRNVTGEIKPKVTDDHASDNNNNTFSDAESVELTRGAENVFMFKMKVKESDFEDGRLVLPYKEAREHFPEIEIPPETHETERMCFTNARNKNWFVEVTFKNELDTYVIQEGGKEFVNEHDLKAAEVMKFYKPDEPSDPRRHFLVECVKSSSHDPGCSSGS